MDAIASVVNAFVLSAGKKEIVVGTRERVDKGIAVWCQCEKHRMHSAIQALLGPVSIDEIDRQLWAEVGEPLQEYHFSEREVSINNINIRTVSPDRRPGWSYLVAEGVR